jgi:hypothetical protein
MENLLPKLSVRCVIVLVALINIACSSKENGINQAPVSHAEVALHQYVGPIKSVQVSVGRDTLPFIFDTGGGFTTITPEVAKNIGCAPFGRLTGFRHNGERIEVQRCGKTSLGLGSMKADIETGVFDLMAVLRRSGDLPVVGGLIALNTFEKIPFTLDFANDKLIIESPVSLKERARGMNSLSARLSRQAGGASMDLFIEVEAKTGTIWLELDSGNNGPVILSKHAVTQLGLDTTQSSLPVTLNVIGLGPVKNEAVVSDLIYDGLLNTKFLNDIILTIDLASGRAWAKKHNR